MSSAIGLVFKRMWVMRLFSLDCVVIGLGMFLVGLCNSGRIDCLLVLVVFGLFMRLVTGWSRFQVGCLWWCRAGL